MFSQQAHYFKDGLDRTYAIALQPWQAGAAETDQQGLTPCRTYARQVLFSFADADEDPFYYGLVALWLDLYQRPWTRPRTLAQLIEELAAKLAAGEVWMYLVDSPLWHGMEPDCDTGKDSA